MFLWGVAHHGNTSYGEDRDKHKQQSVKGEGVMNQELVCYKELAVWTAQRIPEGFKKPHNTKAGSWAKRLWNPNTNEYFTFKVPLFRKYIDTINYAKNQFAGRNTNNVYKSKNLKMQYLPRF